MAPKLIKWIKKKKYACDLLPNKFYLSRYWEHWGKGRLVDDPDHYIKVAAYPQWVKRTKKENKMWNRLIKRNQKKYINNSTVVTQWTAQTMRLYNNWLAPFI